MQGVKLYNKQGRVVSPGIIIPGSGWPVRHLNADTAGVKQLLAAPGNDKSYFVTGYILGGGATADGFHILRRNCLQFTTTDTWTITDGGAVLDIGTEAASGHFALEIWINIPAASAATNLLTRGNPATTGYTFEVTAGGLLKFTIKDASNAVTGTGTTVLNDGQWHLVTVVLTRNSATGLQLYVDGIAEALTAGAAATTAMNDAVNPASTAVQTGTNGKTHYLGPVGMYIGASANLSAATVLSNYNLGIGRKYDGSETGLAMGFNNDEGVGTAGHDVKNDAGYVVVVSGTEWVPSKQNGATAAVAIQGPPFESIDLATDILELLDGMGKFWTCLESATGVTLPSVVNFPHAIKIGLNNPLRILETDGTADLVMFGFTEKN